MINADTTIDRRTLLKSGAALIVSFYLPGRGRAQNRSVPGPQTFEANAWIAITRDDRITLLAEVPEMGQGTRTANATMLADELDADWSTIRVEQAPTIPDIYKRLRAGGSHGTWATWKRLRTAGAQAREMLLRAAAQRWQVPSSECHACNGTIIHTPSGGRFRYGELVEAASKLPPINSDQVPLKNPKSFRLIGNPIPRVDVPSKVDGSAGFGIDVRVPGMLFAVIARCPYFDGELATFDRAAANAVPGVCAVFAVPRLPQPGSANKTVGGVAVVADSTWAAIQGRKALKVNWQRPKEGETSDVLRRKFQAQATAPPFYLAVNQGDALKALAAAEGKIEASYELPLQAHAPMEPMNTTVDVQDDHIEVWSPTQTAEETQRAIAELAGLPTNQVTVRTTLSGGSFGRRAQWDYPAEAWQVAHKMRVPVQLTWTREDDIQHDFYRPHMCHHLAGLLDNAGNVIAWSHRIVSTSIHAYFNWDGKAPDPAFIAELELGSFEDDSPYLAQNVRLEYNPVDTPVPRAWWRSVGTALNAFATESFIDELAHASGKDPYEYRLAHLREERIQQTGKLRGVLELAAEKSGWHRALPSGHGRGIACYQFGGTYVAQVAEVSVDRSGILRVSRVVAAVDCGLPVNPDNVRAQIESGINYALTPVLSGEITIKDGAAEQSNFHDYRVLRMADAPDIEVHIVPAGKDPADGVGESGVPPLAPAVANAVFAATGVRLRRLPVDSTMLIKTASA